MPVCLQMEIKNQNCWNDKPDSKVLEVSALIVFMP